MCPEAVTVFVWCSKLLHSSDFFVDVRFVKTTHTIFLCELKGVNITQTKEVHHNLSAIWEMKTFLEKIMWFPASVDSVKFVNLHSNIANHEIRRTCEILGRLTYFNWNNLEFWRFTFFSPSATLVLPIRGPQKRALLQSEAYFPARKTQCARPSLARKRNRLRRGDSSAALSGVGVKTAQQSEKNAAGRKWKYKASAEQYFDVFVRETKMITNTAYLLPLLSHAGLRNGCTAFVRAWGSQNLVEPWTKWLHGCLDYCKKKEKTTDNGRGSIA